MNGFQKVIKIFAICFGVFLIVNIFSWAIVGISFFAHIASDDIDNAEQFENDSIAYDYSEDMIEGIDRIDVDIRVAELIIESGTEFSINVSDEYNFDIHNGNGKITIKERDFWYKNKKKINNVKVVIPKDLIKKIDIDTGAGNIKINDIYIDEVDIDHGAGKLDILNSKFNEIRIDGGAGKINIASSELNNLKLNAGVGKVDIEGKLTGKSKIECGIGVTNISLKGDKDDYRIITKKGIGNISVDGKNQADDQSIGDGDSLVKVERRNR